MDEKYQKTIQERVYQITDYLSVLKDVMDDIVYQTHMMSDDELKYDRGKFIGMTRKVDLSEGKKDYLDYQSDIHSLSIEISQLVKYGEILYNTDDENVDEQDKKYN